MVEQLELFKGLKIDNSKKVDKQTAKSITKSVVKKFKLKKIKGLRNQ